jgi:CRP-like cAMP-binding protein
MTLSPVARMRGNALLAALPDDVRKHLEIIEEDGPSHDVLIDADEPPEWLWFPHRGTVVSMTRTSEGGATVEVGIIGSEGLASMHAFLSPDAIGADAVIQIAGSISRVPLRQVRELLAGEAAVRDLLLTYAGAFLTQVSQHAVCNRLHSIEQRLAKWLLGVRDRIDTDEVTLTHDFLSHMLGIRRSGVTVAVGALVLDGLVQQSRSSVTILDREGLQGRACECYGVMTEAMRPLIERVRAAG